jgi:FtsP/CotA-like multicopper oxidase with cupredoxin domain
VHLGLAGFYLLRNDVEDALGLPSGEYEVPVVVQDKSFNSDGTIAYPAEWNDTWFANHIIVNGKILPKMTVKRGKYRFRFLNGSGSRFYRFRVVNASGTTQDVVQIGTDGGLVDSPRTLQDFAMGPAERYEIVIDFEQLSLNNPGETEFFLVNDAPILYPGVPGNGVLPDVMRFDVTAEIGHTAALPVTLKEILPIDETQAVVTRRLSLGPEVPTGHGGMPPCSDIQWFVKSVSETRGGQTTDLTSACGTAPVCGDGICQAADGEDCSCSDCNGQTSGNPNNRYCCGDDVDCTDARCGGDVAMGGTCDPVSQAHQCKFWDDISEKPVQGDIEVWEFDNPTGMVHPMHMHLIMFQVLERCDRNAPTTCFPPNPEEIGWKDTVHAEPGMITKVKVDFSADYTGKYAYHCHILEHEDDEMMRQMRVTHSVTDCDNDGICEPSEDCESCPGDCAYVNGAECGDGLCEAMDGEDCNTCAADCDLVGSTCCGEGGTCEPECADRANGRFCRMLPVSPACCGDMVCEGAEADGSASCDIDCLSCGNDLCEPGETSASCPVDCPDAPGICGDDVCDPGEDACNCFADCGEPEICDDGIDNDCSGGTDCADIACFGDPACPSCGDGTCNGSEDQCSCSVDCGTPPSIETSCTDGISNDCDADVDCDDIDCADDQACQACSLGQLGDSCSDDTDCCSSKCKGKAGSQTCK